MRQVHRTQPVRGINAPAAASSTLQPCAATGVALLDTFSKVQCNALPGAQLCAWLTLGRVL